jgi:uncharacterized protein
VDFPVINSQQESDRKVSEKVSEKIVEMNNSSLSLYRTKDHKMSPRRKRLRKVLNPPVIKGFKPYGLDVESRDGSVVNMHYEEYEAIRLCDYDMHNHDAASLMMGVSRPTFTRIYAAARQKVARAFVEGSRISIEGGKVYFDTDWYHCRGCRCYFNNPEKEEAVQSCPLCGDSKIAEVEVDNVNSTEDTEASGCTDFCTCPQCGHQHPHTRGVPCSTQLCPDCSIPLIRQSGANYQVFRHRSGNRHSK